MAVTKHLWIKSMNLIICKKCGHIKRADGKTKPCPGKIQLSIDR